MSPGATIYDILSLTFNGTESLLQSVHSQDEANRLISELSETNRQPSTFYYWVARRSNA